MILSTHFNLICIVWISLAVIIFPLLFKVTQPYGMHSRSGWGPMVNNKLAWFLMEIPALLVFLIFALQSGQLWKAAIFAPIMLWCMHYVHRALIYPFRIKTKGKKMPVLIMLFGIFFNTINGFLNGYWLSKIAFMDSTAPIVYWRIGIGIAIFLMGFAINKYHDFLLIQLRRSSTNGYKIPHGGLFKYVSCPNYLGEIITWLGFLIVCFSLPALSFLIWTMVNLIPRAVDHHKWYKSHFEEYPKDRKSIFPRLL